MHGILPPIGLGEMFDCTAEERGDFQTDISTPFHPESEEKQEIEPKTARNFPLRQQGSKFQFYSLLCDSNKLL